MLGVQGCGDEADTGSEIQVFGGKGYSLMLLPVTGKVGGNRKSTVVTIT